MLCKWLKLHLVVFLFGRSGLQHLVAFYEKGPFEEESALDQSCL